MAIEIKTQIIIKASSKQIWDILTNFNDYPNWNPFIISIKGNIAIGEKITVKIKPPNSSEMAFKPKVLTFKKNLELSWLGHLLFPGVFDGTHKFEIIENENGTTTFIQSELFKGILVPFFKKQLNTNTRNGFIEMNKRLKKLAET